MCGIAGFYGFEDKNLLKRMCDIIEYRGPDDYGYYTDKNVGLGMRRLSIIDVNGGKQPIFNEDGSIVIVFNGEIYNFAELKKLAERRGHRFYTNSDTEVIVHLYEIFGERCVDYLRGMFAFAVWDSNKKVLFLARDRLGKKPLYYTFFDGKLLFGSEIKSILQCQEVKREVNLQALHEFLTLEYVPGPKTMFKNIYKLQPGRTLTINKNNIKIKKYWEINISEKSDNETASKEIVFKLLEEAVKIRLMSEVPLGVYLSGGVDSSAITAIMSRFSENPVNTFTVGFGHHTDEFKYANIISEMFGTNHKELFVDQKNFKTLPQVVWHFDEPIADPAALPTFLMAKNTKKYATVVLVGEGGDETFSGYEKYSIMMKLYGNKSSKFLFNKKVVGGLASLASKTKKWKKIEFLKEFSKTLGDEAESFSRLSALGFTEDEKKDLYSDNLKGAKYKKLQIKNFSKNKSLFQNMMEYDMNFWLPDRLLMKVDKMTMAASIEARTPFMDHKLVEFANTLSPGLRLNKNILKKSLAGILPKEILYRKKHGFAVPIGDWFDGEMKEICMDLIEDNTIKKYFRENILHNIIKDVKKVRNDHKLWSLINFEIWHAMFIDSVNRSKII